MSDNDREQFEESEQAVLNGLLLESVAPLQIPPEKSEALRRRLETRAAQSVRDHAGLLTVRARTGGWRKVKAGIRAKPLWRGTAGNSVLLEFAPGTALPVHRHRWTEEGIVLRGGLQMGELELGPGDYHVSPAGSRHAPIRSRQGALAYLRGTSLGQTPSALLELLGGLLPFTGPPARTVFAGAEGWREAAPGLSRKDLWSDGRLASRFYRLEPGARLEGHAHPLPEECLMLEGELFLGDILLQAGDYQLAPAGSRHGPASTDVGALLFVRGAAG